jgi:hypothetical protein
MSKAFIPALHSALDDGRSLGLSLRGLHIGDGLRFATDVALDHPLLGDGFHDVEVVGDSMWRWTNGRLRLPSALWAGCKSYVILRVTFNAAIGTYWVPPAGLGAEDDGTISQPGTNVLSLRAA